MTKPKAQKPKLPASGGSYTTASNGDLKQVAATQPKSPRAAATTPTEKEG